MNSPDSEYQSRELPNPKAFLRHSFVFWSHGQNKVSRLDVEENNFTANVSPDNRAEVPAKILNHRAAAPIGSR